MFSGLVSHVLSCLLVFHVSPIYVGNLAICALTVEVFTWSRVSILYLYIYLFVSEHQQTRYFARIITLTEISSPCSLVPRAVT